MSATAPRITTGLRLAYSAWNSAGVRSGRTSTGTGWAVVVTVSSPWSLVRARSYRLGVRRPRGRRDHLEHGAAVAETGPVAAQRDEVTGMQRPGLREVGKSAELVAG